MPKLYCTEWCPYCVRVLKRINELGVKCEIVNVPDSKSERRELIEISGQAGVPTMVTDDGRVIADDDDAIIEYMNEHYGK